MLKMAQSPDPVSIPKPAMTARTPLTMPPATSAGMIGEKMPVRMSSTLALPPASRSMSPALFAPRRGSNSRNTSPTLGPIMTCHCPSLIWAPMAPSICFRASRSPLESSARFTRRRVIQ